MKIRLLASSALLTLLVCLYFLPALNYHFSGYDDQIHIARNRMLQPLEMRRIAYFWRYPFNSTALPGVPDEAGLNGSPWRSIYSPLTFTVWSLLASQAHLPVEANKIYTFESPPLNPFLFHSFSILLQAANVILLFLLLYRLTKNVVASWIPALIFAIHPVQIEAVVQCTGMNNLLAGFWTLLAFHCYLGARSAGRYALAAGCFGLALVGKPSAVPFFLVILAVSWLWEKKSWRHYALTLGPWALLALASVWINRTLQPTDDAHLAAPLLERPIVVGDAFAWYLAKLIWPFPMAPDYGRRFDWVLQQNWAYVTWLVPTSGVIGYYFSEFSTVADHYLYLPFIPLCCALACLVQEGQGESGRLRTQILAPGVVWLLVLLVGGRVSMLIWSNDALLWQTTYRVNPRSWLALGAMSKEADAAGNMPRALDFARRATEQAPDNWIVHVYYARALSNADQPDGAMVEAKKALQLYPRSLAARLIYGNILSQRKQYLEASKQFVAGLEVQPYHPELLGALGVTLCKAGDGVQGSNYLKEAMRWGYDPGKGNTYIGIAAAQRGDFVDAKRHLLAGLKAHPEQRDALYNLGLLAQRGGDTAQAESYFRHALKSDPQFHPAYFSLAELVWARGDGVQARGLLEAALKIKPDYAPARTLLSRLK